MEKITITVYLERGEKFHTEEMSKSEARAWIKKWMKKNDVYSVYDHIKNEDISYNFTK